MGKYSLPYITTTTYAEKKQRGERRRLRERRSKTEKMGVDGWADLPPEIIETIAERLTIYVDYLRCRAVCRSWRSSVPATPLRLPPQLPCLMLSRTALFHLSTHKTHLLNLPEPSSRTRNCGSSHGWLITVDQSPYICLLNPITRATLSLPPLHSFPSVVSFSYSNIGYEYFVRNRDGGIHSFNLMQMCNYFIRKVVLSSSPSRSNEFAAFAIVCESNLAFCRNGDDSWVFVREDDFCWEDAAHHDGSFYAVSKGGAIAVCDVEGSSPPRVSIVQTTPLRFTGDIQYVVFSGGDMLLVSRILEHHFDEANFVYRTVGFEVFKMDWGALKWDKIESLGDRALFLGKNSSLSLCASDFVGCLGDCIYFTDDYSDSNYDDACGKHDLGIFRLWDNGIEPLPCYPQNSYSRSGWPLAVWVSPNPC